MIFIISDLSNGGVSVIGGIIGYSSGVSLATILMLFVTVELAIDVGSISTLVLTPYALFLLVYKLGATAADISFTRKKTPLTKQRISSQEPIPKKPILSD
jgi:hypothetical protein